MKPTLLNLTEDGSHTIVSDKFGESYHSRHGAVQESRHVFIAAGLHEQAKQRSQLRILEFGFGSGLNAALTWQWAREQIDCSIHYTALEAYPISIDLAQQLNYSSQLALPDFLDLHHAPWDEAIPLSDSFTLEKVQQEFEKYDPSHQFDLIYYDAFAPSAQPELWQEPLLAKVFAWCALGAILVTYCAKGSFKRALKAVGFEIEGLPGPPGKREMTRAVREASK